MWRSGPIGSEWVDLGGTVNKGRGSSLVPKRKESPTDQGRAFLGIFMMRMRRHHEFMCVSLTCTDHLFSKHRCVYRAWEMSCFSICVCDVVWWIVLPLHKAIWVFVYSPLYSFCIVRATDGEWWRDIKKLKHTAFLPHSQLLAQKDFLKLALRRVLFQTFWTSSPFSFTHTFFCLSRVLSRFGPVHTVFVYCVFAHNSPRRVIRPA